MRYKLKHRVKQGVPIGYKHNWYYGGGRWKETKGHGNTWRFVYKSSKSRGGSSIGGPPVGYRIRWKINALQDAVKVSGRKYKTKMFGYKRMVGYYDPRQKRWRLNKRY